MTRREEFELYVLSQMSARDRVEAVLAERAISAADLDAIAARIRATGLDEPGALARAYRVQLGEPDVTTREALPGSQFDGSLRHTYRLATWPAVAYVVHEHPDGWVWGQGFEAADPARVPRRASDLAVWAWTLDAVEPVAHVVEVVDHWTATKQLRFTLPDAPSEIIDARFVLGLLQSWTIVV